VQPKAVSGVYILSLSGRIVYIGESRNCAARVWSHRDKDFDSYWFGAVDNRKKIEADLISRFKPKLNVALVPWPSVSNTTATTEFNVNWPDLKRRIEARAGARP